MGLSALFEPKHFDYIGRLYDVALNPEDWRPVLDEFCGFIDAGGATIQVVDPLNEEALVTEFGGVITKEVSEEYNKLHAATDMEAMKVLFEAPKRVFIHDFESMGVTDIDEIAAHPPIRWLEDRIDLFWRVGTRLNVSGAWLDMISFQWPRAHGPMSKQEKAFSMPFMSHFAKTVEIGRSFRILESRFRAVLDSLDHLNIGVFITQENGTVVVHNREAQRMIDLKDGLGLDRAKQLSVSHDDGHRTMAKAISETAATANGEGERSEVLLSVRRRSGDEPFLMAICPLRDDKARIGARFRGSLIFAIDPDNRSSISTDGIETLFALSPAEADVLKRILDGEETNQIADSRNTSPETVRGQIKSMMQKTNTHKRADLVRLTVSVNIPIDHPKDKKNR